MALLGWFNDVRHHADAVGRHFPPKCAIRVESEGPPCLDKLETRLFTPEDETLSDPAIRSINEIQRIGAELQRLHDLGDPIRVEPFDACAGFQVVKIQSAHTFPQSTTTPP